jgi:hypothetical protein
MELTSSDLETVDIELDQATAYFLMRLAANLGVPPEELKQSAFEAGLNRELNSRSRIYHLEITQTLCKQPKNS